jgi:hypothetical protein
MHTLEQENALLQSKTVTNKKGKRQYSIDTNQLMAFHTSLAMALIGCQLRQTWIILQNRVYPF